MTRSITRADVAVVVAIVALGALQVLLVRGGDLFVFGDTTYLELANSIVIGEPYGFNDTPGTLLPPGFPSMIALLCTTVGCGHAAVTRAMAIFVTLGFLATYALIRRVGGRAIAALACLLPLSSPEFFMVTTTYVMSDLPFFAALSLALWVAMRLDETRGSQQRMFWSALFAAVVVICLLLRSAAASLLLGLVAWLLAARLLEPRTLRRRWLAFGPALALGAAVQVSWMVWGTINQVSEWPLGGYPKSYLSQVLLVSGNHPELGNADWSDLARRVDENLRVYTAKSAEILVRHWILPSWGSPAVSGSLLLVLVGLGASLVRRAGSLHDWTFLVYAGITVLWPWDLEVRFLLPMLPLATWYAWSGALVLGRQARARPRVLFPTLVAASALLTALAAVTAVRLGSTQALASAFLWLGLGGAAAWLVWTGGLPLRQVLSSAPVRSLAAASGIAVLGILLAVGVARQVAVGRENLAFELERARTYPDIEAAKWLRTHSSENAVLMARQVDVVHHHSGRRRVVWFPPLTRPEVLIDGIRRHGVQWLVVTEKSWSYWRPKEADCFAVLAAAHPGAFRPEAEGQGWRIFAVDVGPDERPTSQPDVAAGPPEDTPPSRTPR